MAENYKILGQALGLIDQEKVLYSSPVGTQTLVTNITVTNRESSEKRFDINIYNTGKTDGDFASTGTTNTFLVATSSNTSVATSTNGLTWTLRTQSTSVPSNSQFEFSGGTDALSFGLNKFVHLKNNTRITQATTDGITWKTGTLPYLGHNFGGARLAFGGDRFLAINSNNTFAAYSKDGLSWQSSTAPSGAWLKLTYGNGRFVATAMYSTTAAHSTDGITWSITTMPAGQYWSLVDFGNNRFVAVVGNPNGSDASAYSTDGITWTSGGNLPSGGVWTSVVFGNNRFVALGAYEGLATSTDGITWTGQTLPFGPYTYSFNQMTFGNNVFVAPAYNSTTSIVSTDGITWTLGTLPSITTWSPISFGQVSSYPSSPSVNNIYKESVILGNTTEILEPGIVLDAQNSIVVKGSSDLSFSAYGVELS